MTTPILGLLWYIGYAPPSPWWLTLAVCIVLSNALITFRV